ncbi:MAG: hypothetical protein VXW87_03225, partial [Pseudomonadota bacterium]|nr:hypothetical protein [Pseudomonadota bacterium]
SNTETLGKIQIPHYPGCRSTITDLENNEWLHRVLHNPAQFLACDKEQALSGSYVAEQHYGTKGDEGIILRENKGIFAQKFYSSQLGDCFEAQKVCPRYSDLMNLGGFAPRLRFWILDKLLDIILIKVIRAKFNVPAFFKDINSQKVAEIKRNINDAVAKLKGRDSEKLEGRKIDFGFAIVMKTIPIFRLFLGHESYHTTRRAPSSSWYEAFVDYLKLIMGISQYKILSRYVNRMDNDFKEDYGVYEVAQKRRPLKYKWGLIKQDLCIVAGLLLAYSLFIVQVVVSMKNPSIWVWLSYIAMVLPYVVGISALCIFMKDYDLGTYDTSDKTTLALFSDIFVLSVYKSLAYIIPIYSAISLLLATPFAMLRKVLLHTKASPWGYEKKDDQATFWEIAWENLRHVFYYNGLVDILLTVLETISSLVIFDFFSFSPVLYACCALLLCTLTRELVTKGKGLIYYKFKNHAQICSQSMHFSLPKLPECIRNLGCSGSVNKNVVVSPVSAG